MFSCFPARLIEQDLFQPSVPGARFAAHGCAAVLIFTSSGLSEFGFQICGEAVDGYEAIMKAQLLKPDLIVLEVAIPRLNGVEAAPKLRKLLPKTPIILFTLHGTLLEGCDTREIGVDAVVAKQDGVSALRDSVHTLFPQPSSRKLSPRSKMQA
jgi:DNA-binding NarL/FixJ family response regulator